MKSIYHKTLFKNGLIQEEQFNLLEEVYSHKKVSVFYELRTLLFLGVMLFSSGVGILIYQNIASIGHVAIISILAISCLACFFYTVKKALPFAPTHTESPSPYYDYITLLGCLVLISIVTYIFILAPSLYDFVGFSSLVLAFTFFGIAYRFNQLAVLSLGITAIASYFGLSISTQKWYSPEFFESAMLYQTGSIFSICLASLGILLHKKNIKTHFTFTYLNYAALLFFVSTNTGIFMENIYSWFYVILQLFGSIIVGYYSRVLHSYLFLIYGFVFGYIALIYSIAQTGLGEEFVFIAYLSIFICIGFVLLFLKTKKNI